jgi:hypothetical protein
MQTTNALNKFGELIVLLENRGQDKSESTQGRGEDR